MAFIALHGFYAGASRKEEVPTAVIRDKQVFDFCALAYAAGVRPGQTRRQGRLGCPGLALVPYDEAYYRNPARRHLDVYAQHTPGVEPISHHQCFLDLSGPGPALAELQALLAAVVPDCAWGASGGLAPNKFLARAAAERLPARPGHSPVGVVTPEQTQDFLSKLPVECLWPVDGELRARLALLGIKTVGQLVTITAGELQRRFGKGGRLLAALCRGEDPQPVRAAYPEELIRLRIDCGGETEIGGGLLPALDRLAAGLAQNLAQRVAGCRRLELTLEHGEGNLTCLEKELARPRSTRRPLLEQLMALLNRAGSGRVVALEAVAAALVRVAPEQLALGAPSGEGDRREQLDGALEGLARKYRGMVVRWGTACEPDRREAMLGFYDPLRYPVERSGKYGQAD